MNNPSIPRSTVIPELAYADVAEAVRWLCDAFGFTVRLTIGNHRAQLNVGDGAMVVTGLARASPDRAHSVRGPDGGSRRWFSTKVLDVT